MKHLTPLVLAALCGPAHAQLSPNFQGRAANPNAAALSADALNGAFQHKQDVGGDASGQHVTIPGRPTVQTLATKFARVFDLGDFGAAMDCVTDDTPAWQAALAAIAAAGSGELNVPAGCTVVDSVTLATPVTVHGQGPGVSTVKAKTTSSTPFVVNGGYHVTIEGLNFTSTSSQVAGNYVDARATYHFMLDNFEMGGGYDPILIEGGAVHYVTRGLINNSVHTMVKITGGNDQYLEHLVGDNAPGAQPVAGLLVTNNGGLWAHDIDFIHSGNAISFATVNPGDLISWAFLSDVAADTSTGCGIDISAVAGSTVEGLHFDGSWTSSNVDGVCTSGAGTIDGVTFNGHRALRNAHRGFYLTAGTNIAVNGSQIAGNSAASLGAYAGVEIGVGVSGVAVRGNRIGAADGFGATQGNNIAVDAGGSDHLMLADNDLRGFLTAAIADNSTGLDKQIHGNLPIPAPVQISPSGSPYSYTAAQRGAVYIGGGAVTAVQIVHQGVTIPLAASVASLVLDAADQVVVAYTAAPAIVFVGD